MNESHELAAARAAMAAAEAAWASAAGLARLGDALGRLADIIETGGAEARIARNLAASYAGRFYGRVRDKLERDDQVPEPELEHYFKVVLAFDQVQSALPAAAAELKIGVVEALIERYYEGHPPEKTRAALEQLAALRSAN
jgi:hypothetical protein